MLRDPALARLLTGGPMSRGWRLAVEGICLLGKGGGGCWGLKPGSKGMCLREGGGGEDESGEGRIGSVGMVEDEPRWSSAGRDGNGLC